MAEWKKLEPIELLEIRNSQRKQQDDAGVQVELSPSPYDLPEAVRGSFETSPNRFVIEFKYIQPEEWVRRPGPEDVILRVGKNSRRLYGIEIDVSALGSAHAHTGLRFSVEHIVGRAIESLAQGGLEKSVGNYRVVGSVVQRKPEIFRDLAA